MLQSSTVRPGAIPGRPDVVEPFSASLRRISISDWPGTSKTTDTQSELQTASSLADKAGYEFLYAFSHLCTCAWMDCMT